MPAGGRQFHAQQPLGAPRAVIDWSAEPVAREAAAALAAALESTGTPPLESCLEEVLDTETETGYSVSSRRVHASPEDFAHTPGSAAAALNELPALGRDFTSPSHQRPCC